MKTSQASVFHGSLVKLCFIFALGVATTALSATVALGWTTKAPPGSFGQLLGYIGTFLFGLSTCLTLKRLASIGTPILTLTPDGFFDVRISTAPIPWSVVEEVETWQRYGQKLVVLHIRTGLMDRLPLTRFARWNLRLNRMLGADNLYLRSQDLPIGHRELLNLCIAYVGAARSAGASAPKISIS